MKTTGKMSTLYTSEDAVDYCIESEFKNNTIEFNKSFLEKHEKANPLELVFEINTEDPYTNENGDVSSIRVIDALGDKGNEWKLQSFYGLIQSVIDTYKIKLNCRFVACLNDGLPITDKYTKFSTFGRHKSSNHIGMPDPLVCGVLTFGYKIRTYLNDDIPFSEKKDGIIFRGSDTSKQRENLLNQRLTFCINNKDCNYIDSKITFFAHYSDDMLRSHNINKNEIYSEYTTSEDQLKYKYIAYINGNTVSGDRMMWQLASNSLLIQVKPKENEDDYIWYHSFLNSLGILPTFPEESFLDDFKEFEKREDIEALIKKQQYFASIILDRGFQMLYTKEALVKYNEIYNAS